MAEAVVEHAECSCSLNVVQRGSIIQHHHYRPYKLNNSQNWPSREVISLLHAASAMAVEKLQLGITKTVFTPCKILVYSTAVLHTS